MKKRFTGILSLTLAFVTLLCALVSCTPKQTTSETPASVSIRSQSSGEESVETPSSASVETPTPSDTPDTTYREVKLSEEELKDKIAGGWIGQMAGVSYGLSTEFHYGGRLIPASAMPKWDPSLISIGFDQDDLYVEIPFLDTMKRKGVDCSPKDIAATFARSTFALWHANGMGRDNLNAGIPYPDSGSYLYNCHADDIDWQIECDFLGMLYPGQPKKAAERAFELGHIMNYGDGVYGGVFISAMHAAAFTATSIEEICLTGMAAVPEGTLFRDLVNEVYENYKNGDSYEENWAKIQERWGSVDLCPELPGPSNIDAKINSGYVMIGLLYGEGDFDKTIYISTRCGQDSDCNPSSAASILGNYTGEAGIPEKYTSALDRTRTKFTTTIYTFDALINLNCTLMKEALNKAGCTEENGVYTILSEVTFPPVPFEQWPDGVYVLFDAKLSGNNLAISKLLPYSKNEEVLSYTIDMGDGTVFKDVTPVRYTYRKAGDYTVTATVVGDKGSTFERSRTVSVKADYSGTLTDDIPVCTITRPEGGGSKNIGVISDGVIPKIGSPDSAQYDTYILTDPNGAPGRPIYIGYVFRSEKEISRVSFTEGNHFGNGGWFAGGDIRVEVLQNGVWNAVSAGVLPEYPTGNSRSVFGDPFETYVFTFDTPVTAEGVRIAGTAGGSAAFISVGELSYS